MTPDAIDALARALLDARAQARYVTAAGPLPTTPGQAYAVQRAVGRLGQHGVPVWKVTALAPADRAWYASDMPVTGPLFDAFCQDAPGRFRLDAFVAPKLEAEIAYVLAADLARRDAPYARTEVEAMVGAIVPAFEIADARVPADASGVLRLADALGNGAFVAGTPVADWRAVDLATVAVTVTRDGAPFVTGRADHIAGDPFAAVVAFANTLPDGVDRIPAGTIVTTGTCVDPLPMPAGSYVADFGLIGRVAMTVD